MSVEIYEVEASLEPGTICLPVSSERYFTLYWERAIAELQTARLGNGVWLYRSDFKEILDEFSKIKSWAADQLPERDANYMISHIDFILENLPGLWSSELTRLWMG